MRNHEQLGHVEDEVLNDDIELQQYDYNSKEEVLSDDRKYQQHDTDFLFNFKINRPNQKFMESNIGEIVEKIDVEKMRGIFDLYYDEDRESGDKAMAEYLESVLGIDDGPEIVYVQQRESRCLGSFLKEENKIKLYKIELYTSPSSSSQTDILTTEALTTGVNAGMTLAHELWHAYQYKKAKEDTTNQAYLYNQNFSNYIHSTISYSKYANQLIEYEAEAFSQCLLEMVLNFYNSNNHSEIKKLESRDVLSGVIDDMATGNYMGRFDESMEKNKLKFENTATIEIELKARYEARKAKEKLGLEKPPKSALESLLLPESDYRPLSPEGEEEAYKVKEELGILERQSAKENLQKTSLASRALHKIIRRSKNGR